MQRGQQTPEDESSALAAGLHHLIEDVIVSMWLAHS